MARLQASLVLAVCLLAVSSADQLRNITDACNSCIAGAKSLSATTSSSYRDFYLIKQHICSQIPAVGQPACEQLLEGANPALRSALARPVQACERLGACTKQEQALALLQQRTVGDLVSCPICEYVVVYIKEQLQDPDTEKALLEQATQICQLLPDDVQTDCLQTIAEYGQQILAFIHQEDPEEICEMAQLCDPSLALPELPQPLKAKTKALFQLKDDDECNTCKLVIVQASAALADPETQKEIISYAKQQCGSFQAFQDQCEAYVELYGPLALTMARQYLSPDICSSLGFCTTSAAKSLGFSA